MCYETIDVLASHNLEALFRVRRRIAFKVSCHQIYMRMNYLIFWTILNGLLTVHWHSELFLSRPKKWTFEHGQLPPNNSFLVENNILMALNHHETIFWVCCTVNIIQYYNSDNILQKRLNKLPPTVSTVSKKKMLMKLNFRYCDHLVCWVLSDDDIFLV